MTTASTPPIPGHDPVGAAEHFVADHDRFVRAHSIVAARAEWDLATTGGVEHAHRREQAELELRRYFTDHGRHHRIRAFDRTLAGEPRATDRLRRQVRLLKLAYLEGYREAYDLEELVHLETEAARRFNVVRGRIGDREVDDNEIRRVLRHETSGPRRREAWEASKQIGPEVAPLILDGIRLRNEAAQHQGYRDHWSLHLVATEIDEAWLDGFLDELDRRTRAPYRALKGEIDAELARRHGVATGSLRPWHYPDPFFQEPPPDPSAPLDDLFADRDLIEICRRTFERMGLDVDRALERSDLEPRDGKNPHAFCLDLDRAGDVRVLCNVDPTAYWAGTLLHELGHAAYDLNVDRELPFLLRTACHTLTTEAVAMLMGRLVSDPTWLAEEIGVPAPVLDERGPALARATRAGRLLFARWALTFVRFERSLYRDPSGDLVDRWWSLVEETQGLARPEGRDAPDWAAKIHLATYPAYYPNYLLGETLASQLAAALHRRTGRGPVGNPEAGAFLVREVFAPGASIRWDELVRRATGEDLGPAHYLDGT